MPFYSQEQEESNGSLFTRIDSGFRELFENFRKIFKFFPGLAGPILNNFLLSRRNSTKINLHIHKNILFKNN